MFQRYRPLIPVFFLVICCFNTIATAIGGTVTVDGIDYNFALNAKHYGAFAAVAVALACFLFQRKYYKYCLALILVFGLFSLINFTAMEYSTGLTFGEAHIGLNPVLMVFGLLAYFQNRQRINAAFFSIIKPSDERIASIQQEEIAKFKSQFAKKSSEELSQIISARQLVTPALTAAWQLLQERQ